MKTLAALLAALVLAACAQREADCERSTSAELLFTDAALPDRVIARTLGETCSAAVGVLVIMAPDGRPLWSWSAPLHPTFGNLFEPRSEASATAEDADAFLARWAALHVETTGAARAWRGAGALEGARTPFDRATYEDVRARDLPMACYLSGVARETCLYWEPGAADVAVFIERDVAAAP